MMFTLLISLSYSLLCTLIDTIFISVITNATLFLQNLSPNMFTFNIWNDMLLHCLHFDGILAQNHYHTDETWKTFMYILCIKMSC